MIRLTGVKNGDFAVNEDYIIAVYPVDDEDAEENAVLLMDVPDVRENTVAVKDTADEIIYEMNF